MNTYNTMSETIPNPLPAAKKTSHRVRIGLLIGGIVLLAAFVGSWLWAGLVLLFLHRGLDELTRIMEAQQVRPSHLIVKYTGYLMILAAAMNHADWLSPLLTISLIASFFRLLFREPVATIGDIGSTLLAVIYLVYLPVHFILLRNMTFAPDGSLNPQAGLNYLLLVIFVVGFSDVAAYYTGKAFGKNPLYPEVSPKKTREGALGGVLAGVLAGTIISWLIKLPLEHGMILSLILVVVGQMGDLIESLFKRNAGLKDSGEIFLGHGGLLDRTDSYIFSGPIAYYYLYWIVLGKGFAQSVIHQLHRLGFM